MTNLLTAAQMRSLEAAAIASGRVTGLELMERAGAGVLAAVLQEWPNLALTPHRAVVLCGPGNNGGDGFVVARLLVQRGWAVEVYLYGDAAKLPPDARVNYERWVQVGKVQPLDALNLLVDQNTTVDFDLIVDAVFGTGLSRAVPAPVEEVFLNCFRSYLSGYLVAIDVPSGLCADSGRPIVPVTSTSNSWPAAEGWISEPMLTVTFHSEKLGHALGVGPQYCSRVVVVDIGLQTRVNIATVQVCDLTNPYGAGKLAKGTKANKFTHGHALIVSGDHGHAGAARLAARGALRIGAGLVTVASPPGAMAENAARLDAIMLQPVADAAALVKVLADARINALCLGPGMGVARAAALLPVAVRAKHTPYLVLDADALTALAQDPALFALLNGRCVITPHAGEFARLFPDIAAKLAAPATRGPAYSKVDATREAAVRAGCVVLYKGADTVIAAPDGRCSINAAVYDRSAPWLATAGSGDVLAGFITGLLARGFAPMQAAETAAWLHVECARSFGPGLIAEDLPEQLPKVFRCLGL